MKELLSLFANDLWYINMPLCFSSDVGTGKHNLLFRKVKRILLVKHLRGVNLMRYILILLNSFMLIFVLNFYVRF